MKNKLFFPLGQAKRLRASKLSCTRIVLSDVLSCIKEPDVRILLNSSQHSGIRAQSCDNSLSCGKIAEIYKFAGFKKVAYEYRGRVATYYVGGNPDATETVYLDTYLLQRKCPARIGKRKFNSWKQRNYYAAFSMDDGIIVGEREEMRTLRLQLKGFHRMYRDWIHAGRPKATPIKYVSIKPENVPPERVSGEYEATVLCLRTAGIYAKKMLSTKKLNSRGRIRNRIISRARIRDFKSFCVREHIKKIIDQVSLKQEIQETLHAGHTDQVVRLICNLFQSILPVVFEDFVETFVKGGVRVGLMKAFRALKDQYWSGDYTLYDRLNWRIDQLFGRRGAWRRFRVTMRMSH